jgi:chromosome partitioning protein
MGAWEPSHTVDEALESDQPGVIARITERAGWPDEAGRVPDVAPSSPSLARRETQLATDPIGAQDRLRIGMEGLDYDVVLIDCPPALNLLTVNGLFAADKALVVTEPAAWARDGVEQVLRTIERISARRSHPLEVAGIVINRLGRTRDAKYWHDQLVRDYGAMTLPPIHLRTAVAEASAQSLPIHALGNRTGAPEASEQFDELLDRILSDGVHDAELRPAAVAVAAAGR